MPTLSVCACAPSHGISSIAVKRRPEVESFVESFMCLNGVSQADEIRHLLK